MTFESSKIEEILDYPFNEKELLEKAFTHESFKGINKEESTFENLKNLGDKILGHIVWDHFFKDLEDKKIKKAEVRAHEDNAFLREIVISFELDKYLRHVIEKIDEHDRESLWGNLLESIVAAIYLDSNKDTEKVKSVLENNLGFFSEKWNSKTEEISKKYESNKKLDNQKN